MVAQTVSLKECCYNCKHCFLNEEMWECKYNETINNSPFACIVIPDRYICSCKHFEDKECSN